MKNGALGGAMFEVPGRDGKYSLENFKISKNNERDKLEKNLYRVSYTSGEKIGSIKSHDKLSFEKS